MLGAIIGDIVGSRFEFCNHRSKDFDLFSEACFVTDDSVMTLAVAQAIVTFEQDREESYPVGGLTETDKCRLRERTVQCMQTIGRQYPDCGYGGMFARWMFRDRPQPYNSFGNGAAMRISPAGFAARSEAEAIGLARAVTAVTHNHPEGIKGAEAVAVAIHMARQGALKDEIRRKIASGYYPLDFTIDEIRASYRFNETCQETVPQAIVCFLESGSFEDAIRTAISLGGDSDTIAAITGSLAEAYYGIPEDIRNRALTFLDNTLRAIFDQWETFTGKHREQYRILTKYLHNLPPSSLCDPHAAGRDRMQAFAREFSQFAESSPQHTLSSCEQVLARNNIIWSQEGVRNLAIDKLDAPCLLALIAGAIRAEWLDASLVRRWLQRLKTIDWPYRGQDVNEICLNHGGYGTHLLLFTGQRAFLFSGKAPDQLMLRKRFSPHAAGQLRTAWDLLQTEYWRWTYPETKEGLSCPGILWSLSVRFEGSRGILYQGCGSCPENWDSLLGLFGISAGEPEPVIVCAVSFQEGGRRYQYQTTDSQIQVGDRVVVPVGPEDAEQIALVESVKRCRPDQAPYPLAATKQILRKLPEIPAAAAFETALFQLERPGLCSSLTARIEHGCLKLEGQDVGRDIEQTWSDSDREWFYSFSAEMTALLHERLKTESGSGDDLLTLLAVRFGGIDGEGKFRDYCDTNKIDYAFFVY